MYTTGEVAQKCQITVRTVQYYDRQGLVHPTDFSEGGRRLYSEEDLQKLQIVTILREMDFSIKTIRSILEDDNPNQFLQLILKDQEQYLTEQIELQKKRLQQCRFLQKQLSHSQDDSIEEVLDMAHVVQHQKELRHHRMMFLLLALPLDVIELISFFYALKTGHWWLFAVVMFIVIMLVILLFKFYMSKVTYVCANCHQVFDPTVKENFFANHTLNTRKLTCPHCGTKGFCLEVYRSLEDHHV